VAYFNSRRSWLVRTERKPLMTANEAKFFGQLRKALAACHVFPQVSFAAFMTDEEVLPGKARWKVRARVDRKIADFLIFDRNTLKVPAIVELDDRTNRAQANRQRDALAKAAGYITIRFPSKPRPTVAEIAARLSSVC
jgi:very-short-patch-repair endonuclease